MILEWLAIGYCAGLATLWLPRAITHGKAKYRASRCSWCGGRRTDPKQPVCRKCLPSENERAAPRGWPVATFEDP